MNRFNSLYQLWCWANYRSNWFQCFFVHDRHGFIQLTSVTQSDENANDQCFAPRRKMTYNVKEFRRLHTNGLNQLIDMLPDNTLYLLCSCNVDLEETVEIRHVNEEILIVTLKNILTRPEVHCFLHTVQTTVQNAVQRPLLAIHFLLFLLPLVPLLVLTWFLHVLCRFRDLHQ